MKVVINPFTDANQKQKYFNYQCKFRKSTMTYDDFVTFYHKFVWTRVIGITAFVLLMLILTSAFIAPFYLSFLFLLWLIIFILTINYISSLAIDNYKDGLIFLVASLFHIACMYIFAITMTKYLFNDVGTTFLCIIVPGLISWLVIKIYDGIFWQIVSRKYH